VTALRDQEQGLQAAESEGARNIFATATELPRALQTEERGKGGP